MRVVILDGDVPYPPTSGKRLRTLNLMVRLARRHNITYIGRCAASSSEARLTAEYLRNHGIEPVLVDDPVPMKNGLRFYGRLAANLFSRYPYSVASHRSRTFQKAVERVAARRAVNVWQLEWSPYLLSLPIHFPGRRLLMAHNVDSLIWQRYFENAQGFARRWFLKKQWRRFQQFEQESFRKADRVIAVSNEDAALIRDCFGQPCVDVVENGIDRAYHEAVVSRRDPRTILFLGALDWRPNQDAVHLLLDEILPKVLSQAPEARLVLVGRNPPPGLAERVSRTPRVELHADVPDVRPYLAQAGVMAVPLRIGGGSRLKILEALACALPVVSTGIGAEGLQITPDQHYTRAELHLLPDALVRAIRNPGSAQAQAHAGQRFVLNQYDWDTLANKLEDVWERAIRNQESGVRIQTRPQPFVSTPDPCPLTPDP
ncbi:MAG: glycosyltransferase family 4 protein [Gemmataceae bacterium]|nr:glycosyltransferase family 4 protein [Gemmataceae bacterium]MCI0739259.1 glycosyltransferase family 4 protein [Gemmataceae bacterium]